MTSNRRYCNINARNSTIIRPSKNQTGLRNETAAIRGMIEKFAAGAEIREICDCRDRREKFTP
jgi:hypothetical protein